MSHDRRNDPRAFLESLIENQTDQERTATVDALREALDDMRAGDTGIPVKEAIAELRRRHRLLV